MKSDLLRFARTRVYGRLERAVNYPILVVCAPAGFGKTTIVREFFAATGRPCRWVEIAPKHGELLDFIHHLAACLADLAPTLLASLVGVTDRAHWGDRAAGEIATWIAAQLDGLELSLVVDGLENIVDERLFALLSTLVDRSSSTRFRWVLVAQAPDRLPLARWLADDRMDIPIDDVDLAITLTDLAAASAGSHAPMSRAALGAISRRTAGWPASVALALQDVAETWIVAPEPAGVWPYAHFADRAFAARTEREQRFLLDTCVYESFDDEILQAAGWTNIGPLVAGLRDAGGMLFISDGATCRYHKRFRAFLERRLRLGSADGERGARLAAARAYERIKRWPEALELFISLGQAHAVAGLVSEHGFDLLDRGEADVVQHALDVIGEPELTEFPVALAVKASLESLHGSFDLAEACFAHAMQLAGDSTSRGPIVLRYATDLVRRERPDAIDFLRPIVALGGHELGLAVSLAGLLATAYATQGQAPAAAATIERAFHELGDLDDSAIRAKLYFQAGYVAFFGGDHARAKTFAQQARVTAVAAQLYDIAARALSILYNIAVDHEDDVRAGCAYLDELAACSIKAGSRNLLVYATLAQFEAAVYRGDLAQTARLDAALQSLEVGYSVLATETLLPAQALRATWGGDFARAYRLIAPTAEKQITSLRRAQRYAEIALYAAAAGLGPEAAAAVRRGLAIVGTEAAGDTSLACTRAYLALALILLGRYRRAAHVLSVMDRSPASTPRVAELREAVAAISERWEHGRYPSGLMATLDRLDACDLGGIGRLIEALPLPEFSRGSAPRVSAARVANVR